MKSRTYLLFLLPFLALACRTQRAVPDQMGRDLAAGDFSYERVRLTGVQRPENYEFSRAKNYVTSNYYPDTLHPDYLPVRHVQVAFHVMNSRDTLYDMHGERYQEYIKGLIYSSNKKLADNPKSWLMPDSMDVPALPTRLRIEVPKNEETGKPALYEHYDNKLYGYLHDGPKRNRGDVAVVKKYADEDEGTLDIFLMGLPRESLQKSNRKGFRNDGIFLGQSIKLTDPLSRDLPVWELRKVFTHEMGHALGLWHAWTRRDGCDDTPVHANKAWSMRNRGPGRSSNNLMDYGPDQEALTPCQIGRMHARMADPASRERQWVRRDWCDFRPDKTIVVGTDYRFDGARDFRGGIRVENGATLTINARVHLPEGAKIQVAPSSKLVLGPEAIIHNDCGGRWGGIEIGVTKGGLRGKVATAETTIILNEAP